MRVSRGIALFLSTSMMISPAVSATLSSVQGAVFASGGTGWQQAVAGRDVKPGDRIMLNEGGSARITYPGGCSLVLDKAALYVVPEESECAAAAANSPDAAGLSGGQLALGAVAVAGAGAIIYFATRPSSP